MRVSPGNTLKDSFYKQRLIQSNATSFYNTFTRTANAHAHSNDSDDDLPGNVSITEEEQKLNVKECLSQFGKVQEGQTYGFVKFSCTHKMLRSINIIKQYQYLEQVDLSYNKLKSLKYLSNLKYLIRIKATNNQLVSILDTKHPPLHLDSIDVSSNKITKISNLSANKHLRILNLRSNQITVIEGISKNLKLESLDLAQNRIEEIGGLDGLELKELNLSNNNLSVIKGMTKLQKLRVLDLSLNKISKLSGLTNLQSLRSLKLSKNAIKNIREIANLENLIFLSNLDLCFNPVQERRCYRTQVIYKLLMLQTLDGTPLTNEEVQRSEDFYGLYVEEKFNIFKSVLPEEEFIDRRIHRSELVENETDSEGEQNNFVDDYDQQGRVRSNSSRSKNKSFNASKRSGFSRNSRLSKKSSS